MAFRFDAEKAKRVKQRWSGAVDALLGRATDLMLEAAAVRSGVRVLDIAAGTGGQTFRAAARAGPGGSVVATDIVEDVLRFAESEARAAGIRNVEFRPMPCELLTEPSGTFDSVISRNGLQYVSDLQKGLAEVHRVLRPGGRLGAVVWAAAARNGFLAPSFAIARRNLHLPPPGPDDPDPFRLGEDGVFQAKLENAGFRDVRVVPVEAPAVFASASEGFLFQREAGGELLRLLARGTGSEQADAWREIEAALQVFETDQGFIGPGALLVASASK